MAFASERPVPLASSRLGGEMAERSFDFGRNSATANIAMARAALVNDNCNRMEVYSRRAAELNMLEPDNVGLVGSFMLACGEYDAAEYYLGRAVAYDPETSMIQQASMIFLKLLRDDPRGAMQIVERVDLSGQDVPPNLLMAVAVAYAENGRMDEARRHWLRLTRTLDVPLDSKPEAIVARFAPSRTLTKAIVARLWSSGITPTAQWPKEARRAQAAD
ncbi:MAG: hypothetical protein R3E02_08200 [Blastomonas sp.]